MSCYIHLSRIVLFLFAAALLLSSHKPVQDDQKKEKAPNIIIILMDDMGYGDLECYGGFPYHTPNINRLAAQGMRFTNFYAASPVCSASRAALLTGCYPNRVGITGALFPWSTTALNPTEETIAELLKAKGYKTGMLGKWHLGQREPFLPMQHGFDEFLGIPYSNDMWPRDFNGAPATDTTTFQGKCPPLPLLEGNKKIREISTLEDQSMLTATFTERAVKFIRQNKQRPFFLYLAHPMVHVPIAASKKFRGKSGAGMYGDVMEEVDWSVGEIMTTLKKEGLSDNTMVIFFSDNGPWPVFGNHAGSAGGLREGKLTTWEGGVRVPCIMSWPGKIRKGELSNNIVTAMDILPTVIKACSAPAPVKKIDGVNIWPLLTQQKNVVPRDEFAYYLEAQNLRAIRKGRWKLHFPHVSRTYNHVAAIGKDRWPGKDLTDSVKLSLYDLRTDPGETLDVKERHPKVVKQLQELANKYRNEFGDVHTGQKGLGVRPPAEVKQL